MQEIRLVAIDLDGTLLDDAKQVSRQTAAALLELPRRGVKVVIASARPPRSVRHIYNHLQLDTWQINYNGALIWDEPNKAGQYHCPIDGPLVLQIARFARQIHPPTLVSCEILDRWHTDRFDQSHTTETGKMFQPDVVAELESFCHQPVTKLLLLGDPAQMTAMEPLLLAQFAGQVSIVRTDADLLQIMHTRVSKAAALKIVAEHYTVPPANIMAIGDAPNDLGMLEIAGIAIAMDNAHTAVKQAADWIAPSNNNHGVHAALLRYGLCR